MRLLECGDAFTKAGPVVHDVVSRVSSFMTPGSIQQKKLLDTDVPAFWSENGVIDTVLGPMAKVLFTQDVVERGQLQRTEIVFGDDSR